MAANCNSGAANLPWEVLCTILQKVHDDSGNHALLCMEVCKEWNVAMRTTAYELKLINNCRPLSALPGVAKFGSLRTLCIENCHGSVRAGLWVTAFEALGSCCTQLAALHIINVRPTLEVEDAAALFRHCTTLQTLNLTDCMSFYDAPPINSLTALKSLTLSASRVPWNLRFLPPLHSLYLLTNLVVTNCHVHSLPALLPHSPPLQHLDLSHCCFLQEIDITHTPTLLSLTLNGCHSLRTVHGLETHESLQEFKSTRSFDRFARLKGLDPWPNLACVQTLKSLSLTLEKRAILPSLAAMPQHHLQHLELSFVEPHNLSASLNALPDSFETLDLSLTLAHDLPALSRLHKGVIRAMKLDMCSMLSAEEISSFSSLQELEIRQCLSLRKIPSLRGLLRLRRLTVTENMRIIKVPKLVNLAHLSHLDLSGCRALTTLPTLDGTPGLRHLELSDCERLQTLPAVAHLESLTFLGLQGCRSLKGLSQLDQGFPPRLRKLLLQGCSSVDTIPSLAGCTQLEELTLGATKIRKLLSISKLRFLRRLSLQHCEVLEHVPSLSGLVSLRVLDMVGCDKVERLPPLGGLQRLRLVEICRCLKVRPGWLGGLDDEVVVVRPHDWMLTTTQSEYLKKITRLKVFNI